MLKKFVILRNEATCGVARKNLGLSATSKVRSQPYPCVG